MPLSCRPSRGSATPTPVPMSSPAARLPLQRAASGIRPTWSWRAPDAAAWLLSSLMLVGLALRRSSSCACSRDTKPPPSRCLQAGRDHCLGRALVRAPGRRCPARLRCLFVGAAARRPSATDPCRSRMRSSPMRVGTGRPRPAIPKHASPIDHMISLQYK